MQQHIKSELTKNTIADSLKLLLEEKQLDKISIKEIVNVCGLNRQTFYYHFKDIYDLVEWIFEREALCYFHGLVGEDLWNKGLIQFLKYLENHRKIYINVFQSISYEALYRYCYQDFYKLIMGGIEYFASDLMAKKIITNINYNLFAEFYVLSFSSVLVNWTLGNMDYTPEELIEFFDQMITDQMVGINVRLKNENKI